MKFVKISALVYLLLLLILYMIQDWVIFRVSPLPEEYKFEFDQPFIEKDYISPDGTKINTLFFPTPGKSKGLIFNNHGNRRNISRWGRSAKQFTSLGYDVLFYDYRGFGKTRGTPTEENLHKDASFLYSQMMKTYSEDSIVIYGRSLGSGVATNLAVEYHPKMLILESPYYHMADVGKMQLPLFPYEWLIKHPFRTDLRIAKVRCPVYLIHGTEDKLIPYESSLKLAKKMGVNPESVLLSLKGGEHRNLSSFELYKLKWKEWLAPEMIK